MRRRAVSSRARTGAGRNRLRCSFCVRHGAIDDLGDLLAAEDADDLIDLRALLAAASSFLPLGQAAGDDDGADAALLLEVEHLADDAERLLPGRLDEAAGVDDDDVGPVGVGREGVAVLGQLAEHPLGIDGVLRAAEGNEGVSAFRGGGHQRCLPGSGRAGCNCFILASGGKRERGAAVSFVTAVAVVYR